MQHWLYVVLVNTRIDHVLELIVHVWCAGNVKLVVWSETSICHGDRDMGLYDALDVKYASCHLIMYFDDGVDRIHKRGCTNEILSDHVGRVAEMTCVTFWASDVQFEGETLDGRIGGGRCDIPSLATFTSIVSSAFGSNSCVLGCRCKDSGIFGQRKCHVV